MKSKYISDPCFESYGEGRGGGTGCRRAPAKHGSFIPQQAGLSGNAGLCRTSHLGSSIFEFQQFPNDISSLQACQGTSREKGRGKEGAVQDWYPIPGKLCRGQGELAVASLHTGRLILALCRFSALLFQAGKTPNRLLCSRSALSKVLLKRGNESICIFLLKHGGMFLVTLYCTLRFAPGLLVGWKSSKNTCILPI